MSSLCTLEELLQLALRTPEIGAVNFNYLYQVIHEILKHLNILGKPTSLTEAFAEKLQASSDHGYIPLTEIAEEQRVDKAADDIASGISSEKETSEKEIDLKSDAEKEGGEGVSEIEKEESRGKSVSEERIIEKDNSSEDKNLAEKSDVEKESIGGSSDIEQEKDVEKATSPESIDGAKRKVSFGGRRISNGENLSKHSIDDASQKGKSPIHIVGKSTSEIIPVDDGSQKGKAPVHILGKSTSETIPVSSRRSLKLSTALSENGFLNKIDDERIPIDWQEIISAVRDNKTPASDLWQILNTNRRLEAAEDAIQGMTNFIDNISSDLSEVKEIVDRKLNDNNKDSKGDQDDTKDNTDREQGQFANDYMKNLMKTLTSSIQQLEDRINACAAKKELKDFCSSSKIESMIEKRLALEPKPAIEAPIKKRESGGKISFELVQRINELEKLTSDLTDELRKLESLLDSKADKAIRDVISDLDGKITQLNDEMMKQQSVSQNINSMQERINQLSNECKKLSSIAEVTTNGYSENRKSINRLENELAELSTTFRKRAGSIRHSPKAMQGDDGALQKVKSMLCRLQEEHQQLEDKVHNINIATNDNHEQVTLANATLEDLKEKKLDKGDLYKNLEPKADKTLLEEMISQSHFDSLIIQLQSNIQDVNQRVDGQENRCKKSFGKIEMKLQSKVEHDELEKLKKIIDMKLRDIQGNIPENVEPQDGAAGIRKQLLPDFHCISCDKPVQVMQHEAVPSLPAGHSLPGKRSIRPYMTFELEEIRKHMRGTISSNKDRFDLAYEREKIQRQLLRLCGAHDLDSLASKNARACGGSHTSLDIQKRASIKVNAFSREDTLPITITPDLPMESEIIGRDGRIYKVRDDHLPPLTQPHQASSDESRIPQSSMQQ